MTMSRRDFLTIGEVIHHHLDAADEAGDGGAVMVIDALAVDLAEKFASSTPAFEWATFMSVCGITKPE